MKSFGGSEEMIKMMESPLMTFMSKGWLIVYIVLVLRSWEKPCNLNTGAT